MEWKGIASTEIENLDLNLFGSRPVLMSELLVRDNKTRRETQSLRHSFKNLKNKLRSFT